MRSVPLTPLSRSLSGVEVEGDLGVASAFGFCGIGLKGVALRA